MEKTRTLFLGLMILFFISMSISTISAKSVKLELCTDTNCYNYNDNPQINYNDSIILKVSVINDNGGFMCWKGIQYNLKYISNNVGDYNNKGEKYVSGGFYGDNSKDLPFCFSNSNKIANEFYIPLKDYNEMEGSNRLGSWSISDFKLTLNGLTYYKDVSLTKILSGSSWNNENSFEGNEIKFTVVTDEPKKGWFGGIQNESFKWLLRGINIILGGIAVGIWIHIFTMSGRKKRQYGMAWLFTILSLILTWFGFS